MAGKTGKAIVVVFSCAFIASSALIFGNAVLKKEAQVFIEQTDESLTVLSYGSLTYLDDEDVKRLEELRTTYDHDVQKILETADKESDVYRARERQLAFEIGNVLKDSDWEHIKYEGIAHIPRSASYILAQKISKEEKESYEWLEPLKPSQNQIILKIGNATQPEDFGTWMFDALDRSRKNERD